MNLENQNKDQLESFFEQEYPSMKRYVKSKIDNGTDRDADDIIQDVALKIFSGLDRSSTINNVAGFVYRSIRNKIIDVMRKAPRTLNKENDQLENISDLIYGKDEGTYTEDMKARLKQAVLELRPTYRDIIIAIDLEGYSYKEISSETGIPEGTLMSHRHRAIAKLYKELKSLQTL